MQKPQNYDNTETHIDPVELGGHHAILMEVAEMQSKSGKPMIRISIDFANNDRQPRYFSERYKHDTRAEKKWPYNGTYYIMVEDKDSQTSKNFKGFITSVEESNGFTCQWGIADWGKQFKGRKVGVVFGEEEDEYNDELRTSRRIRFFCEDEGVEDQTVPKKKFYNGAVGTQTTSTSEFVPIPDDALDGLPFA